MKNNNIYLALLLAFSSTSAMADNQTATFSANSILTATCSLSANSINFGAFMLPLSAQSASGSISMLCSNKAPYVINLAYGGIYGQGGSSNGNYWQFIKSDSMALYGLYSSNGNLLNSTWISFSSQSELSNTFQCTVVGNKCLTGNPSYSYGIMKGVAKGDTIAYSIFVPGDSSKVWNAGKNSFSGIGTGQEENINFQSQIVPSQSATTYPTPDFYMDIVTATVTY